MKNHSTGSFFFCVLCSGLFVQVLNAGNRCKMRSALGDAVEMFELRQWKKDKC